MRELEASDMRWVSGGYDSWQIDLNDIEMYGNGNITEYEYEWNFDQQTLTIDIDFSDLNWTMSFDSDVFDLVVEWSQSLNNWVVSPDYSTDYDWSISTSTSNGALTVTATYGS